MNCGCSGLTSAIEHDRATLLQWYEARDTLRGSNFVEQDIDLALQLAASCKHPDACWLTKVFIGRMVSTRKEALCVFSRGK